MSAKLTFNPFSGTFDYIYPQDHHGGYYKILEGQTIIVEEYKTMFAMQDFTIDGTIILNGMIGVVD